MSSFSNFLPTPSTSPLLPSLLIGKRCRFSLPSPPTAVPARLRTALWTYEVVPTRTCLRLSRSCAAVEACRRAADESGPLSVPSRRHLRGLFAYRRRDVAQRRADVRAAEWAPRACIWSFAARLRVRNGQVRCRHRLLCPHTYPPYPPSLSRLNAMTRAAV